MISLPIWLFILLLIPLGLVVLIIALFIITGMTQAILDKSFERDYIKHFEEEESIENDTNETTNQQD